MKTFVKIAQIVPRGTKWCNPATVTGNTVSLCHKYLETLFINLRNLVCSPHAVIALLS